MNGCFTETQITVLEKPAISCNDVEALLGDYAEGDLAATLRSRVDAHISSCAKCQELKAGYFGVIALAKDLKEQPVSIGVQNRLREALNRKLGTKLPLIA